MGLRALIKRDSTINLILLLIILTFAVFLRLPTFKLPHDNGDQLFYLGLAMKLDKFGFSEYTLRNIDLKGNNFILGLFPSQSQKGSLLSNLARGGVTYYDEPLFHRSYGFPYILMFSHRIFSKAQPYLALNTTEWDKKGRVYSKDANKTWYVQFYAAVVPFIFSLLFILITYLLAKMLFSEKIGLISAFLISISPIEILCSQKIWADTMLSFFVALAVLLFFLAKERNNLILACLAGISSGIAVLIKQTGGIIIIAIIVFHLWQNRSDLIKFNKIHKVIFDKYLLFFGLSVFVVIFHWFLIITKTYGHPLYIPTKSGLHTQSSWFIMLNQRPYFLYLASIPYLVPVFALSYFAVVAGPFIKTYISKEKAFLIIWFLTFLLMLIGHRENRYMLPAYPAIAMLSADLLQRIGNFVNAKSRKLPSAITQSNFRSGVCYILSYTIKKHCGDILIIVILIACAFWSVPIGIKHAFANAALILKPF